MTKHSGHIPVLDGIRGIAILLVMIQHFFQHQTPGGSLLDRVAWDLSARGWIGVDLFFVLSGFLITGILLDTKAKPGYLKNFYARRTVRIFPLYYFVLFVFYVVFPLLPIEGARAYVAASEPHQAWYWSYLTNFHLAERGGWYGTLIPNVLWSLAIEEQFYLVWPMVVLLAGRRSLKILCLALLGLSLGLRLWLAARDTNYVALFVLTPTRMDGLLCGAFIALMARRANGLSGNAKHGAMVALSGLAGIVWLAAGAPGTQLSNANQNCLRFSAVALMFGGFLVLALNAKVGSFLHRILSWRFLATLGKYSYALYLLHGPASHFVKQFTTPAPGARMFGHTLPYAIIHSVLAGLLTFALSLITWHIIEKHFLKLKKHFGSAA